jgi:hypothetical protein
MIHYIRILVPQFPTLTPGFALWADRMQYSLGWRIIFAPSKPKRAYRTFPAITKNNSAESHQNPPLSQNGGVL